MGISIASNNNSLRAQLEVAKTTNALSKVFERLSSGLRINSASDDPAGLAMADKLRNDSKLAAIAIRNANDGVSMASIVDSGLEQIGDILSRLSELASQSANGTYTNTQRSALNSEFQALGSEIERISRVTTYNNMSLLSNSSSITLQVGIDSSANSQITIGPLQATLSSLGIGTAGGALTYSIISTSTAYSQSASQNALSAINNALNTLSSTRGSVGAAQSRLTYAINYMSVARENYAAAESRIRDADVAADVAELVRLQVIQQAGTAVLAQANQQPSLVLRLLQ